MCTTTTRSSRTSGFHREHRPTSITPHRSIKVSGKRSTHALLMEGYHEAHKTGLYRAPKSNGPAHTTGNTDRSSHLCVSLKNRSSESPRTPGRRRIFHSHAAWVDSLRSRLASMRLLPSGKDEKDDVTTSPRTRCPPQISLS